MPVVRAPSPSSMGAISIPGATASGTVRANSAVAVINDGLDIKIVECSKIVYAAQFTGFAVSDAVDGAPLMVFVSRGVLVEPILEGAAPLILNEPVFLSSTLGEVVSGPIASGMIFQVGIALSPTQLSLNTDSKITLG